MSQNPYAGSGPQPGYEAWYEEPRQSSLSIMSVLSLVFSILCLTAPLGIIFGVASLFSIGASQGRKHGKGLAISGIVVGLVFSTCMTFLLVGGLSFLQVTHREFVQPLATTLPAIEGGDFGTARSKLSPNTTVTDEQMTAFGVAYQAELGKFKAAPQTGWEVFTNYFKPQQAWQQFSQTQQAGGSSDLVPVVLEFEKGYAIVGIVVRNSSNSSKPSNLVIFTNSGKTIWLVDPRGLPLPGAPPAGTPPSPGDGSPQPAEPSKEGA